MKKRSLLSLLLVLALCLSLVSGALAAEGDTSAESAKIVILSTNDVHCAVAQTTDKDGNVTGMGYAALAAYANKMKATYGESNVTLVDAGDAVQGEAIGTLSKGEYLVDILNKVGYAVRVPGNHEFDYGMDQFLALAKKTESGYVSCNFTGKDGKPVFDAFKMISYGDVNVAYVGICTPETFFKSTPTYFQDDKGNYVYGFCEGNDGADLYASVQSAVDAAKAAGANYVIAVGHLGVEETSAPWRSTDVIANTTGIDALIDGHSHTALCDSVKNKDGEAVLRLQNNSKFASIGQLTIDTVTGEMEAVSVPAAAWTEEDPDVKAYVDEITAKFDAQLKTVVAKTDVELTVNDPATGDRMVRSQETNLGDLCADAYRTLLGTDVAFVNGGGVRANIPAGDITYEQIIAVHPFGNAACAVEATGQQILDALELASCNCPGEFGGFLQVSGLTYTIDTTVESSVVTDEKGGFIEVAGEYRVKDVKIGGEPIDLTKTYTVASHNYMLKSGGDGLNMFKGNKILQDEVLIDNQVLINYIVDTLGGTVGEEYANPYGQGRITVKKAEPVESFVFTDVAEDQWYFPEVKAAYEAGLVNGVTESTFAPTAALTRETFVTLLYRMAGSPEADVSTLTFTDVKDANAWYAKAIAWAVSEGVVNGQSETVFGVGSTLTRQDMITMMYRYAQKAGLDVSAKGDLSTFKDADKVAAYAAEAMTWAVGAEITKGADGALSPAATSNRAQGAAMLLRLSALKPAETTETTETTTEVTETTTEAAA